MEDSEARDLSSYDIVGYSVVSSYSFGILKKFCAKTRSTNMLPRLAIAGGYSAEKFPEETIKGLGVKHVFFGECEDTLKMFLDRFDSRQFEEIPNICSKDNAGHIKRSPQDNNVPDISHLAFPARNKLDYHDIVMTRLPDENIKMVHILFSRGCTKNCYYCAAHHDGKSTPVRYRDPDDIVTELNQLKKEYGIGGFSIVDDCFLTDKNKAIGICTKLRDLDLKWSFAARADQINDEILDVLVNSGCIEIKFGIETGSDELLNFMNKGCTSEQCRDAITKTHEKGITVKVFIISGLPGETEKTHNATKALLSELNTRYIRSVSLLKFVPLPGSHIWNNPEKFGIKSNSLNRSGEDAFQLYRSSTDWWIDNDRYKLYEKFHTEMQNHILSIWDSC
jgi:radical SAM superfamily enzyme YgiQ (UPF0313 family)